MTTTHKDKLALIHSVELGFLILGFLILLAGIIVSCFGGKAFGQTSGDFDAPSPQAITWERPATQRVVDARFLTVNSFSFEAAVMDVELTQSCLQARHCRETNPLLPPTHAGKLALNLGISTGITWLSYDMKKRHSKIWWIPPVANVAIHSYGTFTGFQHR